MRSLLAVVVLLCLLQACVVGKGHRKKSSSFEFDLRDAMMRDDALLTVEARTPDFISGECTCKCCDQPPPERKLRSISKL